MDPALSPVTTLSPEASQRCLRVGRLMGVAAGSFWTLFLLTRLGDMTAGVALWRTTLVLVPTFAVGAWFGAYMGEQLARFLVGRSVRPVVSIPCGAVGGAVAGAVVLALDWLIFFALAHLLDVVDFDGAGLGASVLNAVMMGATLGAMVGAWLGATFGIFVTLQLRK